MASNTADGRDSSPSHPVENRGRYVFGLMISILLGTLFALATLEGILAASGNAARRAQNGGAFTRDIVTAIVSAAIVVVFVVIGMHYEHHLRRHHRDARSWIEGRRAQAAGSGIWPGRAGLTRTHRYSPILTTIFLCVFGAIALAFAVSTVVDHSEATRSAMVQRQGIPRIASVTSYRNQYHYNKGGGYYTAVIDVTFSPSYDGFARTVVHYPNGTGVSDGQQIKVLIDPQSPGYSEIPGAPATKSSAWIVNLVGTVIFAALSVSLGLSAYRIRRHRRSA